MGSAMFNTRSDDYIIRPCPLYIAIVYYGKAKNNGCSATKLKTRRTKWPPLSMKGPILNLPRSTVAYRRYAKVSLSVRVVRHRTLGRWST